MIVVGDWLQSAVVAGRESAIVGSAHDREVGLCYAELATMPPVCRRGDCLYLSDLSPFLALESAAFPCSVMWRFARLKVLLDHSLVSLPGSLPGLRSPAFPSLYGHVGVGLGGAVLIARLVNWRGVRFSQSAPDATPYKASFSSRHCLLGPSVGSAIFSWAADVLIPLVNVSSFGIAVAFLGVTLSLPALRQRFPDLPRPYQVPFGNIVSRLAAGGACMTLLAFVLPMSPAAFGWPVEWGILLFWILLGGVLWVGSQAYRTSISEKERRAVLLQGKLEHIA